MTSDAISNDSKVKERAAQTGEELTIGLICTRGGHLAEMERLLPAIAEYDHFWVIQSEPIPERRHGAYTLGELANPPFSYVRKAPEILNILREESPDVLVSTGSDIAIPFLLAGKALGIHTIFIESVCRIETLSVTGKVAYRLADEFYVQWPELANELGAKAKYEGSVL